MLAQQHITISDKSLVIDRLRIDDPETVAYLERLAPSERLAEVRRALNLGILVINRVQANNDLDFVNRRLLEMMTHVETRFSKLDTSMQQSLEQHLDPLATGSFMAKAHRLIAEQSQQLGKELAGVMKNTQENLSKETLRLEDGCKQLDHSLDPSNSNGYLSAIIAKMTAFEGNLNSQFNETDSASFVGKLREAVNDHFGSNGQVMQMIEEKLRVDAEGKTPLGQVFLGIKAEINELRDLLVSTVAQEKLIEQTTLKGFSFEDQVFDRLQEIARPYADTVTDTSKVSEISGSKKGDYLYEISNTKDQVVLDAKAYKRLNSLPAMLTYIEQAIKDRQANFGVIVVPEKSNLQKQIGEWNVYGNIIITPLEHLETSIKYAKNVLQIKKSDDKGVNLGLLKYKLEEISRKIREFSSVKGKLTKLSNGLGSSITEIQDSLDNIRDAIVQKLGEIDSEIAT